MSDEIRFCKQCEREFEGNAHSDYCSACESQIEAEHPATLDLNTQLVHFAVDRENNRRFARSLVGQYLGQYKIEKFLGRGGMASVFLATHMTLQRPCAVKILRTDGDTSEDQRVQAFLAEARTAASIIHPHVVTLHNIGSADGLHYIEMEYVEGNSLAHHLSRSGLIDPLQATQWMLHISSALSAAHELNLIHRDIKPANVLIDKAGQGKLADFGLAKRLKSGETIQGLSGTLSYMAPELFSGEPASTRSDIYAMGITYYSLLAGSVPVEAKSVREILDYHSHRHIINVEQAFAHLPASIHEVLGRALNNEVSERYASAADLRSALHSIYRGLQPLKMLVESALADVDHQLCEAASLAQPDDSQNTSERLSVRVALENGRRQTVNIEITSDKGTGEEIIRLFSVCGLSTPEHFERALRLNASISHGSLAIQAVNGAPHFVMSFAYPRATCDPPEVRSSVIDIARHSDEIERLLSDEDLL